MGLFDKFKKKKTPADAGENSAYMRNPNFYTDRDGAVFGAFALTRGTDTVLPKRPQNQYLIEGKQVSQWRILFVSIVKQGVIGDSDYFTALNKLENYSSNFDENHILVRGLTLAELKDIYEEKL